MGGVAGGAGRPRASIIIVRLSSLLPSASLHKIPNPNDPSHSRRSPATTAFGLPDVELSAVKGPAHRGSEWETAAAAWRRCAAM